VRFFTTCSRARWSACRSCFSSWGEHLSGDLRCEHSHQKRGFRAICSLDLKRTVNMLLCVKNVHWPESGTPGPPETQLTEGESSPRVKAIPHLCWRVLDGRLSTAEHEQRRLPEPIADDLDACVAFVSSQSQRPTYHALVRGARSDDEPSCAVASFRPVVLKIFSLLTWGAQ